MIWLGLKFDTVNMSITIPEDKMADNMQLVDEWSHKTHANIHELWVIFCFMWRIIAHHQDSSSNRMLDTLIACPVMSSVPLSQGF